MTGAGRVLLTTSCTSALEMAAMLLDVAPGDEVILPSYTFVTTATAFVRMGATPVFVDVREDTLNLDECLIEAAISPRTKAIVPVHYAGVGCDMEAIGAIAAEHGIAVVEDAAQGVMSSIRGQALGTFGDLAAVSFHETKNLTCGEGGALYLNAEHLIDRAEILREKGTNRAQFFRGIVDKYTWVDVGSSYVLSDLNAAYLWAQLEHADDITARRLAIWQRYHEAFAAAESEGLARRPVVPAGYQQNAHMYYLVLPAARQRDELLEALREQGIGGVFHYVPLHSSPAGARLGRAPLPLPVTDGMSARVARLPLYTAMSDEDAERVIDGVLTALRSVSAVA
jgi:dTDP-4-amino-4,6-dideoxygalactose transaminase